MLGYRSAARPSSLSHVLHQLHLTSPLPYLLLAAVVLLLFLLSSNPSSPLFSTLSSPSSMTDLSPAPSSSSSLVLAINICLLPPPSHPIYQRAHALQPLLLSLYPSDYVFSPTRHAHVTVVQAYIQRASLPSLLAALQSNLSPPSAPLTLHMQPELVPGPPFRGLHVPSIAIIPTLSLSSLHGRVLDLVKPFMLADDGTSPLMTDSNRRAAFFRQQGEADIGQAIIDYVGKFEEKSARAAYYPHVSLGLVDEEHAEAMMQGDREQRRERQWSDEPWTVDRLSIFQLGDWGTVRQRLHELPL